MTDQYLIAIVCIGIPSAAVFMLVLPITLMMLKDILESWKELLGKDK